MNPVSLRGFLFVPAFVGALVHCGGGAPFGTVTLGDLTVEGEVDPDYLYRQLYQLDPTFNACYVRALRKDRNAEGVIRVRMQGTGGQLVSAITANATGSDELASCVTESISALRIVEPDGSAPWEFTGEWAVTFDIVANE